MKLLLDTHAVLWYLSGDKRLSRSARRRIEARGNQQFLSVASIWEIAIKLSLGKLQLEDPLADVIDAGIENTGAALLGIAKHHALRVAALPWHHRDPFDRMIAAQVLEDDLTLLSGDEAFDAYGVRRVW